MTWTEPYVLHDSGIDKRIMEMWDELRPGSLHFLRYHPDQHTSAGIDAAQNHLLQNAKLVDANFGIASKALVTHQLHVVCVHFAEQARQWGPLAFACEWWVERMMQGFKRITKYRTTRCATAAGGHSVQHECGRAPCSSRRDIQAKAARAGIPCLWP